MPVFQDYQPQVPLDIGSTPQVRTGGEAIGQGLQNLGQGLGEAAIGIAHYAKVQQQKDQYQTSVNTDDWKAKQNLSFQQQLQNAPATGDGFAKGVLDNYDKAAQEYIPTVPEGQRERVLGELTLHRDQLAIQASAKEHEIGNAYVLGTLKDSYNSSLNAVTRDPNTRATVQQGLFDRIDQAYYLEPAQREDLKRSFTNGLEFQQVKSIAPADPAAVRQLQGMPTQNGAPAATASGGDVHNNVLLAAVSKGEGAGDYNKVFANGQFGTTPKPVTQMTVDQAAQWADQHRHKNNPDNPHPAAPLGAYQFVGSTILALKNQMGLSGNELMSPQLQDAMAWQNLKNTRGNPAAIRAQWTSWAGKSDAEIKQLWDQGFKQHEGQAPPSDYPTGGPAAAGALNEDRAALPSSSGASAPDSRFSSLTPEQWDSLYNGARTQQNQNQAIARGQLEPVVQDASAALMTNGRYDGQMPTPQQFSQAYGPVEGAQKYSQFQQIQQVGKEIDGYKSMTPDQIASDVDAAKPVGSGDGFAMAQSRYEAVQKAAATTLAMRKADPAKYVQTTSPGVAAQWQNANTPDGYRTALSSMAAAQTQLGIAPQDQKLLPDDFAQKVVAQYKNDAAPFAQRVAAVTNTILRTQDQSQQQVIFQQLVKAGLPPTTEGAIEAYARGDQGAGERLMTAATTDFSKLPAASEDKIKKADLDNAIATQVMAPDQIGGIAYGVRYGGPDNIARAQNGADLMQRAVRMRMAQGETDVNKAVTDVSKDMFGTANQVYNGTMVGMNFAGVIPTGYNIGVLYRGVSAMRPQLESSITQSVQALNDRIAGGDPTKIAVLNAQTKSQVNNIIQNGEITNYGSNGFAFIDPYTNKAVPGPDGKPLVFTLGDVEKADRLNTDYGTQPATGQPAQPAPSVQGKAPALSSAAPTPQPSGNVPNIPVTPQRTSNVPTSGADAFNKAKQQFTPQDAAGAAQIFPGGL